MGRIEELVARYRNHVAAPWQRNLAGDQKAIFLVYPKGDERRLRSRLDLFNMETASAEHGWRLVDLTPCFAEWMAKTDYREAYFEDPEMLSMKLRSDFANHVADRLRETLTAEEVDENTVVAVQGLASLFGFVRFSLVLKELVGDIRGRLLVFFPGGHEEGNYRLLDARDGWNYLAVPITLHNGVNDP